MTKPKMPTTAAEIRRAMCKVNLTHDDIARCQVAAALLVADRIEQAFDLTGEVARLGHERPRGNALYACTECASLLDESEVARGKENTPTHIGCGGSAEPIPVGARH